MAADAESVALSSGGTNLEIRYYVVCLLDVLGQAQSLQGWARLPTDGQPTEEFIESLKKTVGTILGLRDLFNDFFAAFEQSPLPTEKLSQLSTEQRKKFERITKCTPLHTQQFADTFVFYAPIVNEHGDISGPTVFQILTAAAMAILVGLAAKAPVRGAITVGPGTEIAPGNFFGPALVEVHQLESEVAEYPRIVLSQAAARFVGFTNGFSKDADLERVSALYHPKLRELLCPDSDDRLIIDFMGEAIQSVASEIRQYANAALDAYRVVSAEAARFEAAGDEKLASRYRRLLAYMEPRLPIWGIRKEASDVGG